MTIHVGNREQTTSIWRIGPSLREEKLKGNFPGVFCFKCPSLGKIQRGSE